MQESHSPPAQNQQNNKPVQVFTGLVGAIERKGRYEAQTAYIQRLLSSKIVIVTQRDKWEDHWRLLEAVIAGACIFVDAMYGLPAGFENGQSIVVFANEDELKRKLDHYLSHDEERLAVARNGRAVAMSRHRSWHHVEEIVFGRILSSCDDDDDEDEDNNHGEHYACPWELHASKKKKSVAAEHGATTATM